jgi:hypothetical protein
LPVFIYSSPFDSLRSVLETGIGVFDRVSAGLLFIKTGAGGLLTIDGPGTILGVMPPPAVGGTGPKPPGLPGAMKGFLTPAPAVGVIDL